MLNATTFTYDGVFSGKYGLIIAGIDQENVQDTTPFNFTLHAAKSRKSRRFSFAGLEIEEMPRFEFSVISQTPIPDIIRRELLTWLVSRNGFKKLQFHQSDYQDYEYNCIFAQTGLRFINGNCHGINLTASFDSPFAYGRAKRKTISSNGEDWVTVKLINDSDILDGYIYPTVKFKANGLIDNKSIVIDNSSDPSNPHRKFEFGFTSKDETIEIDNELRHITSNLGGNKLGLFNYQWFRLVHGVNEVRVRINGTCTIEWPVLVKIGF